MGARASVCPHRPDYDGGQHDLEYEPAPQPELAEVDLGLRYSCFLKQEAEGDAGDQAQDQLVGPQARVIELG